MVRPFFTEKIAKRVFFHGDDLHSLHKFVNPSILPLSLGGAKGELEAVDFDFINKLLQEENIHRGQFYIITNVAFYEYKELCIYA